MVATTTNSLRLYDCTVLSTESYGTWSTACATAAASRTTVASTTSTAIFAHQAHDTTRSITQCSVFTIEIRRSR